MERKECSYPLGTQLHSLESSWSTDLYWMCLTLISILISVWSWLLGGHDLVLWGHVHMARVLWEDPIRSSLCWVHVRNERPWCAYFLQGDFLWVVRHRCMFGCLTGVETPPWPALKPELYKSSLGSAFPHLEIIFSILISFFNCRELQVI